MVPEQQFKRTRVSILESLNATDHAFTGYELYKRLLAKANSDPQYLGVGYCEAHDRATFESALREVAEWAQGRDVDPVLHIEAHGSERGLGLGDGSIIPWPEVGELLTPINEATRNELFVVFAACNTLPVIGELFSPTKRNPFRRMIVSYRTVTPSEIAGAFVAFYEKLNETKDARAALAAMNEHSEAFGYRDSSMIMRDVFNDWLKQTRDRECLQRRATDVVDEEVISGEIPLASRSLVIQSLVNAYRQDPVQLFRGYADIYFWLDKFPEKREEFEREFAVITAGASIGDAT